MNRLCVPLFPLLAAAMLQCQTVPPSAGAPNATFKSNVPIVLVDVVVTDSDGDPVAGLRSRDFQLLEDGKRQTVASFEEHKATALQGAKLPSMPPGVFTNYPLIARADCVNVLLIDGLNTTLLDQSYVRQQIFKYLKTLPRDARVAVFTLTTRLRMLQDFTSDSSALLAALDAGLQGSLYRSPLLQDSIEKQEQDHLLGFVVANRLGPSPVQDWAHESVDPVGALQDLFAKEAAHLVESRMRITLDSMQALARYLNAFPGRKNVIWVSGSFPIVFFPRQDLPDPFQFSSMTNLRGQIEHTANLLAAARVAIYPVGAQGLMADTFYEANGEEIGTRGASQVVKNQVDSLRNGTNDRITMNETMDELATDTGGRAFYDTNGIGDVLTRITNNSADFYTISYAPTNRKMDGRFRRITVKLATGKEKLSYRRGYYANAVEHPVEKQTSDPLLPLIGFGVPDVSEIVYKIRIAPSKAMTGQNPDKNVTNLKRRESLAAYDIYFAVSLDDLKLDLMPDGNRRGNIELRIVAFDDYGNTLTLVAGKSAISLKPHEYATMQQIGLQLHQRIDIPNMDQVSVHTGICDLNTGRVGTLAIRLNPNTVKTQ